MVAFSIDIQFPVRVASCHYAPGRNQQVETFLPRITACGNNRLFCQQRLFYREIRQRIGNHHLTLYFRPMGFVLMCKNDKTLKPLKIAYQALYPIASDGPIQCCRQIGLIKLTIICSVKMNLTHFLAAIRNIIDEIDFTAQGRYRYIRTNTH